MIDQVSVFLENDEGRLAAVCRTLGEAGISMHALTIADTADYGVVRIICDTPERAALSLQAEGFRASCKKVVAVVVPNKPNALTELLELLDREGQNVAYGYCFASREDSAIDVLKIAGGEDALRAAGFKVLEPADVYQVD